MMGCLGGERRALHTVEILFYRYLVATDLGMAGRTSTEDGMFPRCRD